MAKQPNKGPKKMATFSMDKKLSKKINKQKEEIAAFVSTQNVAPWYRGTSVFHLEGATRLFNAIRDDTEQSTSHRVKACLNMLGLDPMVNSKQIKLLMRLSRGNDLAFLWFLMEMHYKTPKPGTWSVNEQLICSAICHLDMITTLKELDKILPRSHNSKLQMRRARKAREAQKKEALDKKPRVKEKYISPYFEKLPRPKEFGKAITIRQPDFTVDLGMYKAYRDPNHVVPNESNRWYANYQFQTSKRIANNIISQQISQLFQDLEAANIKASQIHTICGYHKSLREMQENLKHELMVKYRDECFERYYPSRKIKEARKENVKKLLEQEIENQLAKFRKQATTLRKQMTLKTLTSDCDLIDVVLAEEDVTKCIEEETGAKSNINKSNQLENGGKSNESLVGKTGRRSTNVTVRDESATDLLKLNTSQKMLGTDNRRLSQMSAFAMHYLKNYYYGYDYGDDDALELPSSQTFFHVADTNKPFSFDYHKIFSIDTKNKSDDDIKTKVKLAFLEALDQDVSKLTDLQRATVTNDKAITKNVQEIWRERVDAYEKEKEALVDIADRDRPLKQYPNNVPYNGNDKQLMNRMLADAFTYLRQNPKFVWAQLPEAHKIPWLEEWIADRYGKMYNNKERLQQVQFSMKIFHALYRMDLNFPGPTANELGNNLFLGYNCKKYVLEKSKRLQNEFDRKINDNIMQQSRIFWFAIRSVYFSPRRTFFAYMPSRYRDIQRFRLWKTGEYRNYKMAWDTRQQKLRAQTT